MSKIALLAAAATFALTAGGASATPKLHGAGAYHQLRLPKKSKILYTQNSNYADNTTISQNFTSGVYTAYDDQAADDFVVPQGATWTVSEVDVSGTMECETCSPTSENVIFYKNSRYNVPGRAMKNGSYDEIAGHYNDGNIAIELPKPLTLKSGHYWVSVIANMDLESEGAWYWDLNGTQHFDPAGWRNPANGFLTGCENWENLDSCVGVPGPDLMFDLRGTSKK